MTRFRCHLSIVSVVATLLVAFAIAGAVPASAQGFGWFGKLFGGGAPRQSAAPAYPTYAAPAPAGPAEPRATRHVPRRRSAEAAQRDTARDRSPPKNASLFVYVFGDSLGQQLASGLDDALSDRPDVAVIRKARGSSGLVTTDYFDWPKAIADLLGPTEPKHEAADKKPEADGKAETKRAGAADSAAADKKAKSDKAKSDKAKSDKAKIDVAVMMVGINDRQPIQIDGKTLQPGTPDWTAVYTKRVMQIDEAFHAKHIPLIWVGIPITRDDNFADDMAAFNEIYRDAAAKTGAVYVDTWEAFSDDNGDFAANGPDVDGQNARLRASDGIHFTRAGARKLAHFVDTHVRRALEGKTPAPELPTANNGGAEGEAGKGKAVAVARPDVGPIQNLNEPPVAARGTLVSVDSGMVSGHGSAATDAITRGEAPPALAGRADDAHWSGKPLAQ